MQRQAVAADKHIPTIGAWQHRREAQPAGKFRRHILERMNSQIDAVVEERLIQLAAEQGLATNIIQRFIADDIAGGLHWCCMYPSGHSRPGRQQGSGKEIGLGKREGALAGTEAEGFWKAHVNMRFISDCFCASRLK